MGWGVLKGILKKWGGHFDEPERDRKYNDWQ